MRFAAALSLIALCVRASLAAPESALMQNSASAAQTIVVLVNGEPVTARDLVQRALYRNLAGPPDRGNAFIERVNAVLTNDTRVQEKFKQRMDAAQPRTPAEVQKATERIKKELVEDAIWRVVSEDAGIKNAVIESVAGDRLKLQAAKRFGIEITDEQVEKNLILERIAADDSYGARPDMNAFYARREEYGISRKTIREIKRAELCWRAVINRIYGPGTGRGASAAYENFSRGYYAQLRQHAIVEHRE